MVIIFRFCCPLGLAFICPLGRRGARGSLRSQRCSLRTPQVWQQIHLGGCSALGIPLRASAGALSQLCTPGCQHLDESSHVVAQMFLKTHRIFLGFLWQMQKAHQLAPQVRSAHGAPHRHVVLRGTRHHTHGEERQDLVPSNALNVSFQSFICSGPALPGIWSRKTADPIPASRSDLPEAGGGGTSCGSVCNEDSSGTKGCEPFLLGCMGQDDAAAAAMLTCT